MKLKSKLVLAASSLLVLSGAAAGTSAFAWFTANSNAYTKFSSATVQSHMEDLKVNVVENVRNTLTGSTTATTGPLTLTSHAGIVSVPDVSYDAAANVFDRPTLTDKSGTAFSGVSAVSNTANIAIATAEAPISIYYHEVELEFSTTDDEIDTGVFFNKATTFLNSAGEAASDLSKAYRVGVFTVSTKKYTEDPTSHVYKEDTEGAISIDSADTLLAVYAPYRTVGTAGSGQEQAKYLPSTGIDTTKTLAANYATYTSASTGRVKYLGVDNFTNNNKDSDFDITETAFSGAAYGYLGKAGKSTANSLKVMVRIWVEGSDSLAINASIATDTLATVSAKLSFIGVNTNGKTIA